MLRYIIDGFNLVHKVPALKESARVHCDLIHYLAHHRFTGSANNKVIIVFDGYPKEGVTTGKSARVIFSCARSADEVIKELLNTADTPSETVVVSDDGEIRNAVRAAGARSLRCSEFLGAKKEQKSLKTGENEKEISYPLQREITEEMRRIWLKE